MNARLPLGPFDTALRQPVLVECGIEGATISSAEIRSWLPPGLMERCFDGLDPLEGQGLAGRICSRSSIAHSLAYCQAVEEASGIEVESQAAAFRAVAAEYERIASHLGAISDVGRALCDDVVCRGPRRYITRVRKAFEEASGSAFGFGMIVPGGGLVNGGTRRIRELSGMWKALERDCGFWGLKLKLSGARLRSSALPVGAMDEDTPPAPAFRAAGLARDARSGENAYGAYRDFYYRPVVREGGTALDRCMLLLGEVRASIAVIRKLSDAEGVSPGPVPEVHFRSGRGVGISESPEGAVEHTVFLGSEGRIIRNRVRCAASAVALAAPQAIAGAFYEDVAPAVISLCLCAACAAH